MGYWFKNLKVGISYKKFGVELKRHCKINDFSKVESKTISISGKKIRCWVGIKFIEEEEECDDNRTEAYK
jgi:hypothetical protein